MKNNQNNKNQKNKNCSKNCGKNCGGEHENHGRSNSNENNE